MKNIFATAALLMLLLTACGTPTAEPIPVATATAVDIGVLQTAAVQTVVANITQTAAAQPTSTPEPTETLTPSPTETPLPLPTETPVPQGTPTQTTCDNLQFISDVSVPDGTTMTTGQEFVKTWKVRNTGTCTWTTGYTIVWGWGEKFSSQITNLTADVPPNAEAEISITLKAPLKPGSYSGFFRLSNNNGYNFGTALSTVIVVP